MAILNQLLRNYGGHNTTTYLTPNGTYIKTVDNVRGRTPRHTMAIALFKMRLWRETSKGLATSAVVPSIKWCTKP